MVIDTHVHSHFSADSGESMENMAEAAIQRGVDVLCFTDHIDYDFDVNEYLEEIGRIREMYGGRVKILAGVELGMQPHLPGRYRELLGKYPLDFAIGSQHLVGRFDPYYPETFAGRDAADVYRQYFEETLENVRAFEDFDSLGHLDYVTRYGESEKPFPSYREFGEIIDEILRILIGRGQALEVNTAGCRKSLRQPNPEPAILKRYRELGGELVTIGADAHLAKDLGTNCRQAMELLRELGYTAAAYYVGHRPVMVDLK